MQPCDPESLIISNYRLSSSDSLIVASKDYSMRLIIARSSSKLLATLAFFNELTELASVSFKRVST